MQQWYPLNCHYCNYRPKHVNDYESHIVKYHPGKAAYPGSTPENVARALYIVESIARELKDIKNSKTAVAKAKAKNENKELHSTDSELSKDVPKDTLGDDYITSFENSPENNIQNQELKAMKDTKGILQPSYGNQKIARISSSNSKTYICQWCRITCNRIICYQTLDFLEKHTINKHPGRTAYPGPVDIQKYEWELMEKQESRKVDESA